MRIKADSKEGQSVARVLVDGVPMVNVVELDTDEGWVKVAQPKINADKSNHYQVNMGPLQEEKVKELDPTGLEWDFKIHKGTVEVEFVKKG